MRHLRHRRVLGEVPDDSGENVATGSERFGNVRRVEAPVIEVAAGHAFAPAHCLVRLLDDAADRGVATWGELVRWLSGGTGSDGILGDAKGFVLTGRDLMAAQRFAQAWKETREPLLLETSIPGVFAAGDLRAGAMNRVASAVGEGSMVVRLVHEYLALT